jgi:single-strand DNA-binding protein
MNIGRLFLSQNVRLFSTSLLSRTGSAAASSADPSVQNKERSLNSIQLIGRVGQDPKVGEYVKEGQSSKGKVVLFSLATNEYMGVDNEEVSKVRVDWHRIAVFAPRLQENVEKYVRQGDRLHVTGRLHYNLVRDKAGDQRYVTSIIADDVIFLTKL